jgi:arsenate reductase (glutaredoxin)
MSDYFPIVMFHNPDCETSRNVLAILEAAGYLPNVIEYRQAGWTYGQLLTLFAAAGLTPREALRETKSPAKELGLLEEGVTEESIMCSMLDHPILVNRPFVVTPKGTRLCRPSEVVLDLLHRLPKGPFYREDGEILIDETGSRLGCS